MRFLRSREELKEQLAPLETDAEWREVGANQIQLRPSSGGIINWHTRTGEIFIQGKRSEIPKIEPTIRTLPGTATASGKPQRPRREAASHSRSTSAMGAPAGQFTSSEYELDRDSELVIGLVGAVGTDLDTVIKILKEKLVIFEYATEEIKVSSDIISNLVEIRHPQNNYERISQLMTEGNRIRRETGDFSILGKAAAARISEVRTKANGGEAPLRRRAFIISSLKHPEEVQALRKIYSNGFFLIGVYADETRRREYLTRNKDITEDKAKILIDRDADETEKSGQHTRDTYHLSDFFINYDGNHDRFQNDIWRTVDLIFGKPFVTPTFDEFAMFMAFSASLRSADLSRQVGAVVARNETIVATGANDVPKYGGGLYWPEYDKNEIKDRPNGRDYVRGGDPNVLERQKIIEEIVQAMPEDQRERVREILARSKLKNITEYGRVVHAEMEALLSCARENVGTKDTTLYCTTFPCHNCAKHIVGSGVKRVVYVEPYPKSKALDFHGDSITLSREANKVLFEPFVGVGPRSFFNLFSTSLGGGYPIDRKDDAGQIVKWDPHDCRLRMQMLPTSYIERETSAAAEVVQHLEMLEKKNGN
jgi:deoxycytidylate deaminase